jgi:hypothetical protein
MEEVKISDFISKYPAFRSSADMLFNYINKFNDNYIVINFMDVDGITHSFASQYRANKIKCNKNIDETNENDNIAKMFMTLDRKNKLRKDYVIEVSSFKL